MFNGKVKHLKTGVDFAGGQRFMSQINMYQFQRFRAVFSEQYIVKIRTSSHFFPDPVPVETGGSGTCVLQHPLAEEERLPTGYVQWRLHKPEQVPVKRGLHGNKGSVQTIGRNCFFHIQHDCQADKFMMLQVYFSDII